MSLDDPVPIQVLHQPEQSRFAAQVEGWWCRLDYRRIEPAPGSDGAPVLLLTHTEVPPVLEGRGIAGQLVAAALAYAQIAGLRVRPLCSYVRAYMDRHPQTWPLRAP